VPPVAVAIGSNMGDRHAHLAYAVTRLRSVLADLRLSSIIETDAVDVVGVQPPFLNAAATGRYDGAARSLLDELLRIEQERGRERPYARAPRTLDLDLILFGDERVEEEGLIVPHPRFRARRFVLEPLAEVGGGLRDPVTGLTVRDLLERLDRAEHRES